MSSLRSKIKLPDPIKSRKQKMSSCSGSEAAPSLSILFPKPCCLYSSSWIEPVSTCPGRMDGSSTFYEAVKLFSRSPSGSVLSLAGGFLSHLFVHEDVDDWIVNRGGLGEVGGQGCERWLDGDVLVGGHHQRKRGVGQPADEEGHHHRDHHARHLPLRLLCCVRVLLLRRSLPGVWREACSAAPHSTAIPWRPEMSAPSAVAETASSRL